MHKNFTHFSYKYDTFLSWKLPGENLQRNFAYKEKVPDSQEEN
jgi:hypothetical protein